MGCERILIYICSRIVVVARLTYEEAGTPTARIHVLVVERRCIQIQVKLKAMAGTSNPDSNGAGAKALLGPKGPVTTQLVAVKDVGERERKREDRE